jgi:hypothetical protein
VSNLDKQLLIPSVLLFLAALIFSGTVVWHDTVGSKYAQQSATAPNGQPNSAPAFSDVTASEGSIPHFAAGNINGAIASISGNAVTLAVIPPGSSSAGSVNATVIVDPDTQIYETGAPIDPNTYNQEMAAYQADPSKYQSAPEPFETTTLSLQDLTVGEQINVLPKAGSVQGTTLHAQTITPLNLAPTVATSTVPATQ